MQKRSRRTWAILALLSYSVAAALAIGLTSLQSRMAAPAQTTAMELQGSPDADEISAAPDADAGDKSAACAQRDCPVPKHELALARIDQEPMFVRIDAPQPNESKAFIAPGDDFQPKSKE